MTDQVPASGRRVPDHVLGVFGRERLSEALAATHRAGFGPNTRVLDGRRSSTVLQLSRAGLEIAEGSHPEPEDLVILVQAPGRVDRVAELFHQLGAQMVVQVQRSRAGLSEPIHSSVIPEIAIPDVSDGALDRKA